MSQLRANIESGFESAGRAFYRHRIKTLLILMILVIPIILQIPKITIDTSTEGFLHDEDPALLAYNAFRDQFGRDEMAVLAIRAPEIFDLEFLKKLEKLHIELRDNVPYIDDITSLINARNTRGQGDQLIVEDLLENWPDSPQALAEIKARAMANPMYENVLISEEGDFTTIVIQTQTYTDTGEVDVLAGFDEDLGADDPEAREYLTDRENSEVVAAVRKIAAQYRAPDFEIFVAGSPVVTHHLKQSMMKNMQRFILMAVVTIGLFLFLMFRRITGVILPLLVVILSLLTTLGLMAFFGVAVKLPTQILPSFILAVGVGDSVHILAMFYYQLQKSRDKEAATVYAIGHSGLAVVMTSLTTAGGLLSFSTAEIAPIADLGIFSSVGVLLALLFTLILLPPLLSLFPVKIGPARSEEKKSQTVDAVLAAIGRFSTGRPKAILGTTVIILILSVWGMTRLTFSHDILGWFKTDDPIRIATETIDHHLRGSISLEVVVDTGTENGLYDPDILNRLERSAEYVEGLELAEVFAGKAWSLPTILKEINQALHENQKEFYTIPDDRQLIAQEFLLFENSGSDDLEDVTDSQFRKARFTVKVPFKDAVAYTRFIGLVDEHFQQYYPDAEITVTGMMALLFRTITNVIISMARSYVIALIVITVLMILLIGKLKMGLLSMIPNLFPILLTLGIMGWFSIPLDLFTMLVGSIAIGLAVDDTVHFMHNYRRYYEESGDAKFAVMETLHTAGRAMLVTTCVLSVGFFIFMFANMNNLIRFGALTGFTIIMALGADYFIAPALMVTVNKKRSVS